MTRRLLLFAAFIGFAAVLLPVQATDSDVVQGGAPDRRTYKQCEEGEFLNTFTGQCSECFECPEGFYERIACSQMSNTLCSSCRSFLVIRNDDYILKCEGGEEKPRLTFFEMLRQRIESTRKQRLEDGLPKLRVEKIVDSSEEDGEEEEAPKVLDGVANVNLLDDSDEDDDTVLAKDFEKEIAARQQEDEDSDSQEEEAVKEDTDDSDDDDDEEEIAVKAVPVADDDEESDSSEEDRENDLPPLPSRDEEDDDSDDESVEEPSRPLIPIREIELEDLADDSDSESVEEEKDVKESAEEMPYDSVQPIARIIIIQNRDQDDSDDSDDSKDSSEEIAAPRLPPRPRYSSESDSDSDSDSDSSESDEEEEVYFGKRNNYKNSQLSVVHFVWRIVLFALFVAALIAFRQFCCRPTNTYQRHVTVVPAFTPEQLGFVSRAADNLKQKVNGNDIKYEKLVEPKPEFV